MSRPMARWCNSGLKLVLDILGAAVLLLFLFPIMAVLAIMIRFDSPGPVLFRQRRPGRNGKEFEIYKFRTMVASRRHAGPVLTRSDDPRLTRVGAFIRRWKLDELPQLFNILRGQMSFVGPRPQPSKLWKHFSDLPLVLQVRPGVTGLATLAFRREEELFTGIPAEAIESLYIQEIMPVKMDLDERYLVKASLKYDLWIIWQTIYGVFGGLDVDLGYARNLRQRLVSLATPADPVL